MLNDDNRQLYWCNRSNIIERCIEIKHNTHSTQSESWRKKKQHANGIHQQSTLSHFFKSADNWIGKTGATSLSDALKSNTTLTELNLESEYKRNNTNGIHQQSTLQFSLKQQWTRLEKKEHNHWVMHWNQTQHSLNLIWMVNTKETKHKWRPSTIHSFPFPSNQQGTILEKQEQHHWVMHWNQTQHLRSSIWVVNTKETTHIWHPSTIHSFPLSNQQ